MILPQTTDENTVVEGVEWQSEAADEEPRKFVGVFVDESKIQNQGKKLIQFH